MSGMLDLMGKKQTKLKRKELFLYSTLKLMIFPYLEK